MPDSDFSWERAYAVPGSLRFLLTPAGSLQADSGAGRPAVEVRRDWLGLLLAFARSRTAAAAYEAVSLEVEVDRQSFARIVQPWAAQGLLQDAAHGPRALARLDLFRQATSAGAATAGALRSHFPLQERLRLGLGADLYPVFGEVFSLRVRPAAVCSATAHGDRLG